MNHEAGQSFVERLTLIWQVEPRPDLGGPRWKLDEDEEGYWDFYWMGYFGDNMTVSIRCHPIDGTRIEVGFLGDHDGDVNSQSESYGTVQWNSKGRLYYSAYVPQHVFDERTSPWMETLRRNVFLSDLPVEATAHEKIEWQLWLKKNQSCITP